LGWRIPETCNGSNCRHIFPVAALADRDGASLFAGLSAGARGFQPALAGILPARGKKKRRSSGKMPDAAAKMAALPPKVRRRDVTDLRDNAQRYLQFSGMRPLGVRLRKAAHFT